MEDQERRFWVFSLAVALSASILVSTISLIGPVSASHACENSVRNVGGIKDYDANGNRGQIQVVTLSIEDKSNFQLVRIVAPNGVDHIDVGWVVGVLTNLQKLGFWLWVEGGDSDAAFTSSLSDGFHTFKIERDRGLNRWYVNIDFTRVLTHDTWYSYADPHAQHTIGNTCNEGTGHFKTLRFAVVLDSRTYWFDWSNTLFIEDLPYYLEVISDKEFKSHGPLGH